MRMRFDHLTSDKAKIERTLLETEEQLQSETLRLDETLSKLDSAV